MPSIMAGAKPMELLLGDVTTGFLRVFQRAPEQCWVAERGGEVSDR